jgi:hypothetical protein
MKHADLFGLLCILTSALLILNNSRAHLVLVSPNILDFVTNQSHEKRSSPSYSKIANNVVIAYAITITKCDDLESPVLPGAAILAEFIHDNSCRNPVKNSTYDYHLYAFLAEKDVSTICETLLQRLGYTTLRKPIPVDMAAINHSFYHFAMEKNGCCGAAEFIKLWSYTLTDHPAVVHLDLDVMILQPLDDMLDVLLLPPSERQAQYERLQVMRDKHAFSNSTMQALITRDYAQVQQQGNLKHYNFMPVQGGFFAIKPSIEVFQTLCDTIQNLEHTYSTTKSWGGVMHSGFWGMPQIQGLLAYYYSHLAPGTALELHSCYFNTILASPLYRGVCTTGMDQCDDCRKTPLDEVVIAHPIFCYKPWQCIAWSNPRLERTAPCRFFLHLWASTRLKLEERWKEERIWEISPVDGELLPDVFLGYCNENHSFVPMQFQPNSLLWLNNNSSVSKSTSKL